MTDDAEHSGLSEDPGGRDEAPGVGIARAGGLDLVRGAILPTTLKLALPVIAANLLNLALNLADAIMVGSLGKESLAALVIANSLLMLLFAFGFGMAFSTITHVSQHAGAGREKRARRSATHSLMLAVGFGLILIILGNLFLPQLMGFFNAAPDVTALAVSYADIMFDYMPFFLLIFLSAAIMQGLGDTITPLIIMACTNAINIFLNYTLIFGMWGFPELGIQGAAIGSVTARAAGSLAIIAILVSGRYRMILRLPDFRPYLSEFWSILRLGIPNSLQSILRNINVMLLYRILSITELPTVAQASLGVGFLSEALAFIPLTGLFTAAGAMVGQNLGAEQPDRAEQAAWVAFRTALILMTIACIVFLTIPEKIIGLFNDDPAVISSGSWYLRINAITQIFQANFVLVGVLRGAGDSIRPLLTHITGQWIIRLPLAYWFARYSGLEEWGVWLAMATSSAIESMIYFWLFRRGYWKHIRIASSADPDDG